MKMLHCRRESKSSKKLDKEQIKRHSSIFFGVETSHNGEGIEVTIKRESPDETTCRICLKEGKLSIFGESATGELCKAIYVIAGIQVSADDPYPKSLCQSCHGLLQVALLFRRTAQESEKILKSPNMPIKKSSIPILERCQPTVVISDNKDLIKHLKEPTNKPKTLLSESDNPGDTFRDKKDAIVIKLEYSDNQTDQNNRVTCPVCKKTYVQQYFKRHMSLHKHQDLAHMCDICGKKFLRRSEFMQHRAIHFYDLPYQCDMCPYRGRFKESIKMHLRSHTGEKPYSCDQCPARFTSKSNLNKHMQTHKTERDFHCEVCSKSYYKKTELELHIKADHKGIKDHVCRICGKAFGYRKQMMKHELKVHKRKKLQSGKMPIHLKVDSMNKHNAKITTES